MTKTICPIMSCRVTSVDADGKTITPTVIKCQEGDCAWWSRSDKACVVHSVVGELIRVGER